MNYAAVIAAAGLSSRMHEFKPMMVLGEDTMIEKVVGNLRRAGVGQIVVVVGYRSAVLAQHLEPLGVTVCENPDYATTKMYDSICLGLRALKPGYDAVYITPGDVPLVRPETMRAMQDQPTKIVRPICGGKLGHPVLFDAELVPELLAYSGKNGMLGAVTALNRPVIDLPVDDEGVIMDADTKEDFKALRLKSMRDRSGGELWPDISITIARGDTILTPESAQFLEMIGHMGTIQSACASVHMSYSKGWRMLNDMEKELGYPLVERSAGGASGGGTELTKEGQLLLEKYQTYRDRVRDYAEKLFSEMFSQ
ncbi:MAG: NTP transferase domain-containing protein [Lachnospiraceae bacterium]|nr:NTP transferase domain-containing protein [Lachnospiraceae bacterium]